MLKRLTSTVAAIALAVSLSACQPTDITGAIDQVQKLAVAACSFLPTASTIAAILTANASLPATAIANAICQAVSEMKPGGPRAGQTPVIKMGDKTIEVHGEFVK